MDVGMRRVVRGGEAGGGGKCTVSSRLKLSPTPRTNEPCFHASAGCRKLSCHPRGRATLRGRRQSVPCYSLHDCRPCCALSPPSHAPHTHAGKRACRA
eukprot:scaffold2183_cov140-Isochrysis_galbana.AAC.15